MSLGWVFVGAITILAVTAAVQAQRGYRSCVCCHPRRRFDTVAERRFHESIWDSETFPPSTWRNQYGGPTR